MISKRMPVFDVVVGLGANLGDRRTTLEAAAADLGRLGRVVGRSPLYETEPLGPPQPIYLNAAVRLDCRLQPLALLDELRAIEQKAGRVRRERWGPRVLDLDILWVAGLALRSEELTIPHPELCRRAFALIPLLDVAPEAISPEGLPYRDVSMTLDRSGIRALGEMRGN
jgi:2-amino-4-hydroxy-6-hydroxymethyldihydropteridine diphosphokinase